jgi:hypothetical protein
VAKFGIGTNDVPIEIRQKPGTTPPTTYGENGFNVLVGKHRINVGCSVFILAGKIAVTVQQMGCALGLKAHSQYGLFRQLKLEWLIAGGCGLDQAHSITDTQARWLTCRFCIGGGCSQKRRGRQQCCQPRHNLTPSGVHIHTRQSLWFRTSLQPTA